MKGKLVTNVLLGAPHWIAAIVSACFTFVFFWSIGESLSESLMYLGLGLALEAGKLHFYWQQPDSLVRRVVIAAMVVVLGLASVVASVSFGVNSLSGDGIRHDQIQQTTQQYEEQIAQTSAQINVLQERLAELPVEWRVNKNEHLSQIETLREEQRELIRLQAQSSESQAEILGTRSAFWIVSAEALGIEHTYLLLVVLTVLAILLEVVIGMTLTRSEETDTKKEPEVRKHYPTRKRDRRVHKIVDIEQYAETVLNEEPNLQALSLREAAARLDITVPRAQQLNNELKQLGIVHVRDKRTVQMVSMQEAIKRIRSERNDRAA